MNSQIKDIFLRNNFLSEIFIEKLLEFECSAQDRLPNYDVRENITGPLVDALFEEGQEMQRVLSDGTIFNFLYRSKIARDFVMSSMGTPDHVWEPQTTKLALELTKEAKIGLVGGAYAGDHVVLISKQLKKNGGRCFAFEPNNDQRGMLAKNAASNGLDNIHIDSRGLWSNENSKLKLEGYDSFAFPTVADEKDEDAFETTTIDGFLFANGIDRLDFLMLDIEGAELEALKGANSFLTKHRPNIIFEVHRSFVDWSNGLENTEIVSYLTSCGYKVFAVRDYNSNVDMREMPIEIIPVADVYLDGPPHGFNMLAIKDESIVMNDKFKICRGVSPKLLRHKNPSLHKPLIWNE